MAMPEEIVEDTDIVISKPSPSRQGTDEVSRIEAGVRRYGQQLPWEPHGRHARAAQAGAGVRYLQQLPADQTSTIAPGRLTQPLTAGGGSGRGNVRAADMERLASVDPSGGERVGVRRGSPEWRRKQQNAQDRVKPESDQLRQATERPHIVVSKPSPSGAYTKEHFNAGFREWLGQRAGDAKGVYVDGERWMGRERPNGWEMTNADKYAQVLNFDPESSRTDAEAGAARTHSILNNMSLEELRMLNEGTDEEIYETLQALGGKVRQGVRSYGLRKKEAFAAYEATLSKEEKAGLKEIRAADTLQKKLQTKVDKAEKKGKAAQVIGDIKSGKTPAVPPATQAKAYDYFFDRAMAKERELAGVKGYSNTFAATNPVTGKTNRIQRGFRGGRTRLTEKQKNELDRKATFRAQRDFDNYITTQNHEMALRAETQLNENRLGELNIRREQLKLNTEMNAFTQKVQTAGLYIKAWRENQTPEEIAKRKEEYIGYNTAWMVRNQGTEEIFNTLMTDEERTEWILKVGRVYSTKPEDEKRVDQFLLEEFESKFAGRT
jgi:hypothetical protein